MYQNGQHVQLNTVLVTFSVASKVVTIWNKLMFNFYIV